MRYPAVTVHWGDGHTSTIPAGESRVVTATHTYANQSRPLVTLVVQDAGAFTQRLSASVLNVSPELTELGAVPPAERDVVSLRGAFADPGTDDRHLIQINWGDGSPRQVVGVAGGTFDVPHRYADEGTYTVTVDLVDDSRERAAHDDGRGAQRGAVRHRGEADPRRQRGRRGDATTSSSSTPASATRTRSRSTGATAARSRPSRSAPAGGTSRWPIATRTTAPTPCTSPSPTTTAAAVRPPAPCRSPTWRPELKVQAESGKPGAPVKLTGIISDPGVRDGETVTIDWGAGELQTITLEPGKRVFEAERTLASSGAITITAEVSDDDGARDQAAVTVGRKTHTRRRPLSRPAPAGVYGVVVDNVNVRVLL